MHQWIKDHRLPVIALLFWLVTAIVVRGWMQINNLTFVEFVSQTISTLSSAWYGVLLYLLVYFLRPLTLFPGTPLTVLAGVLYGFWFGWIAAIVAGLLSAIIPYAFGRWLTNEDKVLQGSSLRQRLVTTMRENPFQTVLTTRFLYLPYDTVNVIAGALKIGFLPFIVATALGNSITAAAMVSIGASLETGLETGNFSLEPIYLLIGIVVWVISLLITRLVKHWYALQDDTLNQSSTSGGLST